MLLEILDIKINVENAPLLLGESIISPTKKLDKN